MKSVFVFVVLMFGVGGIMFAQSQPTGIELNPSGVSRIFPPFDTGGWTLTRGSGVGTHGGDDFFAQDWARDCLSQGQRLYAGISGSVQINPVGDGSMDYYGNTLVIVDYKTGFAQRFAHLERFAPIRNGDLVLAGQFVGTVGATGNVTASSECAARGGIGAHAHVVLYKNVPRLSGRPINAAVTSGGTTIHSAQFTYAAQVDQLVRTASDPTVFAVKDGIRYPVSRFVFDNQGWDFDRGKTQFNPVSVIAPDQMNRFALADVFWPPREGSLIKSSFDQTVFLIQDKQKKGLPFDVFSCRGFSFGSVTTTNDRFAPLNRSWTAFGCVDEVVQALADLTKMININRSLGAALLGTYSVDFTWDPNWELRMLDFEYTGGRQITLHHVTERKNTSTRFAIYWDPDTHEWKGWYRMP